MDGRATRNGGGGDSRSQFVNKLDRFGLGGAADLQILGIGIDNFFTPLGTEDVLDRTGLSPSIVLGDLTPGNAAALGLDTHRRLVEQRGLAVDERRLGRTGGEEEGRAAGAGDEDGRVFGGTVRLGLAAARGRREGSGQKGAGGRVGRQSQTEEVRQDDGGVGEHHLVSVNRAHGLTRRVWLTK